MKELGPGWNREMHCPSNDVCGWCGDNECDGIGCIASLDPDNPDHHEAIDQLHAWLRRGRLMEQFECVLADADGREPYPGCWAERTRLDADRAAVDAAHQQWGEGT